MSTLIRTVSLIAHLGLTLSIQAYPTPEHFERYQKETVSYKWSSVWVIELHPVRCPNVYQTWELRADFREQGYKPMPRGGEVPRPKEETNPTR